MPIKQPNSLNCMLLIGNSSFKLYQHLHCDNLPQSNIFPLFFSKTWHSKGIMWHHLKQVDMIIQMIGGSQTLGHHVLRTRFDWFIFSLRNVFGLWTELFLYFINCASCLTYEGSAFYTWFTKTTKTHEIARKEILSSVWRYAQLKDDMDKSSIQIEKV